MTLIGNVFLGLAAIISILLIHLIYGNHARSGDAGVGYAWSLLIANFILVVCMGLVAIIVGLKGGFAWVGMPGTMRTVWVLGGFALSMLGMVFISMGEGMGGVPKILFYILKIAPMLVILSVLASGIFLLNEPMRGSLPPIVWRLPIFVAIGFGLLSLGVIMAHKAHNSAAALQSYHQQKGGQHEKNLNHIDTTDVSKDLVFLLVYTDANHHPEVREKAIAKIKSRPDWQEELVRRLQNDWAPQVFIFLASNEVENKDMFLEPVRQGVLIQAKLIRENIRNCRDKYDLYEGKFVWEVERVLRSVDKFHGKGMDYRPAVQELRKALNERTHFEKPKLAATKLLDKWLSKH